MKLYHGTAAYNEGAILKDGLQTQFHKGVLCSCCSLSLEEAGFFALRKTPMSDLSKTGIVIEFEGSLNTRDYLAVESRGLLRNEQEIAVLDTARLIPVAIWRFGERGWKKCPTKNIKGGHNEVQGIGSRTGC